MAYQNIGAPRFYVDILQWLKSQGFISLSTMSFSTQNSSPIMDLIGINPTSVGELTGGDGQNDVIIYDTTYPLKDLMPNDKNFTMVLGHNFKTADASFFTSEGEATSGSFTVVANSEYVNSTPIQFTGGTATYGNIDYDGFSIHTGNNAHNMQTNLFQFRFDYVGNGSTYNDNPLKIGSLLYGTYYEIGNPNDSMQHSPDLNLKLSYEYDGIKKTKTAGGASLYNINYYNSPNWGDKGAWELDGVSSLRTGRRVWDLSFSYLSDEHIMPFLGIQNYESVTTGDILTSTDFFSQVWNKTLGGHLPFIFQPDNTNANPDQFAICRFDMDSLQYDQVANNVYNVKLKIRESW